MKRIIIFMVIFFSMTFFTKMRIFGKENINDSIIIQKGLLNESDLIISGYTLIDGKVDGNTEGVYELLYKNNSSFSTMRKRYIVIDINNINDIVEIDVGEKLLEQPNKQITEINSITTTSFFVCSSQKYNNSSYASISFYDNLNIVWERNINNFCPNTIRKTFLTPRGIVLTGEINNDSNQNVYVCEYNFSGELINYKEFAGEGEEFVKSIYLKDSYIYVVGSTNSQSKDFANNNFNSFRTFIYMLDYTSLEKECYDLLGNNNDTTLLDVVYTNSSIHIINKMSGTKGLHYMLDGGYNAFIISKYDYNMYYEGDINGNCVNITLNSKFGCLDDSMLVINSFDHKIELMKFDRHNNASLFDYIVCNHEIEKVNVYNHDLEIYLNVLNKDETIQNYLINDNTIEEILKDTHSDICINRLSNQFICIQAGKYKIKIALSTFGKETINKENFSVSFPLIKVNNISCDLQYLNEEKYNNIFGRFEEKYYYDDTGFDIISTMFVSCNGNENVRNNEVYDIGVKLKFIGDGFLNNEPIAFDHVINETGDYILSLYGPSMQKNILFKVKNLQDDYIIDEKEALMIESNNANNRIDEKLYTPQIIELESSLINEEKTDFINAIYYAGVILAGFMFAFFVIKKKLYKKIKFKGKTVFKVVVLSFLLILNFKQNVINIAASTFDIVAKEVREDAEILYSNQGGLIYSFKKQVYYSNDKNEFTIPDGENYSIVKVKEQVYILYTRQTYLYYFNVSTNEAVKIFSFPVIDDYQVQCFNDEIFIGFTTKDVKYYFSSYVSKILDGYKEKDIAVVKLDSHFNILKTNIFGGDKNELLSKMIVNNNGVYLCGYKDCLSYGDFSLAGALEKQVILLNLTFDLDLKEQQIIDKKTNSLHLSNYKNFIFLKLDQMVIIYNSSICNESNKFDYISEEGDAFVANKYLVTVLSNAFKVKDLLLDQEEIINYKHGNTIIHLSNCLYDKDNHKFIDFVSLQNFRETVNYYCSNKLNTDISFVCSSINEKQTIPVNQVQPLIWGKYKYIVKVKSELFEYNVNYYYAIDFEANVTENLIYPTGYQLLFTGYATLNGEAIYNNYSLSKVGKYIIELKSFEGDIKQIPFEVVNDQIEIVESFYKGSDFIQCNNYKGVLEFKSKNYEIIGIMIDKIMVEKIQKEGDCFIIPINLEGNAEKRIYVEYLLLKYIDEIIEYPVYKEYVFKNINSSPKIKGEVKSNSSINFIVDDKNTIRCLEIVAIQNNTEIRKKYSISDKALVMDGLISGQSYLIKINLLYDVGLNHLLEYPLISIDATTSSNVLELGTFKVESYNGSLRRFSVNCDKLISNNAISKICVEDKILFTVDEDNVKSLIIRCAIIFILSIILSTVIFKFFPKVFK